jgi:hypothetical protein
MKHLYFLVCLFLISGNIARGQFFCETAVTAKSQEEEEAFNSFVLEFRDQGLHLDSSVFYIPVVVHVIMRNAEDSICYDRIAAQIAHTNLHFRRQNPDTIHTREMFRDVAADTHIEICLAKLKPGREEFEGVLWHSYPGFNPTMIQEVMENTIIDPDRYLNVWTRPGSDMAFGVFPWQRTPIHDGIVVAPEMVGFMLGGDDPDIQGGKIFTHELGHYLGLYHTFHGGIQYVGDCDPGDCDLITDRCCDTPHDWSMPFANPDYCLYETHTCDDVVLYPQNENYMYYNPDECLNMFSKDQRIRMRAALSGIRQLLSSEENLLFTGVDCVPPPPPVSSTSPQIKNNFRIYPNPAQELLCIEDPGSQILQITVYDSLGRIWINKQGEAINCVSLAEIPSGFYMIQIRSGADLEVHKFFRR